VAKRTGVPVSSVLPSSLDDLRRGKEEATLDEANKYVANLQADALAHRATTVTTTIGPATTSTTAALTTPVAPTTTAALTTPAAPTTTSVP
jgi:hypothetical protein